MIQHEEKQIGETTYRVTMLGAKAGRNLLVRLFKIAGPVLGELLEGLEGTKDPKKGAELGGLGFSLGDLGMDAVARALEELASRISEQEFAYLCDTLADRTEVVLEGGERVLRLSQVFDLHFAGKYRELFGWLAFALTVNYRDFFGDSTGGALLAGLMGKRAPTTAPSR